MVCFVSFLHELSFCHPIIIEAVEQTRSKAALNKITKRETETGEKGGKTQGGLSKHRQ